MGWNATSFDVYDLKTDSSLWIEKHEPMSSIGGYNAVVAQDMLVSFAAIIPNRGQNKWLCYAKLPPRD